MKKYLILIAYEAGAWGSASPEEQRQAHQDHLAFHDKVGSNILAGEALSGPESATTVRRDEGRTVLTDGPFAEAAEHLGGFYVVQADDLDQVVGWCELLPAFYSLEVRPCVQIDGFD